MPGGNPWDWPLDESGQMKVLDLGCRTGSATAAWREAGDVVVGVDWEDHGQQIIGDYTKESTWDMIERATPIWENKVHPYDFVWFSPDCAIFSMANMRWQQHFDLQTWEPLTDIAKQQVEGIKFVIEKILELNPRLGWVMENPRALMRKMPFVRYLQRVTVTYCQYGDSRMKPTDLFGNIPYLFEPRQCKNGDKCHVSAPRGSSTGTQGMSKTEAGMIPIGLSREIRDAALLSYSNPLVTLEDF